MPTHRLRSIRKQLRITQQVLAAAIGCVQGNVANYERGQTLPPAMARKLIDFCGSKGLAIGFDHVYGDAPLPPAASAPTASEVTHG